MKILPDSSVITAVDVRLLELPMKEALAADHGTTAKRPLAVIGLSANGMSRWAWGESAALASVGYSVESAVGSFETLTLAAGDLIGSMPSEIVDQPPAPTGAPMSRAAIEMAALTAVGLQRQQSLAALLGTTKRRVKAGAAVGLGSVDGVGLACQRLIEAGYRRIKLKIQPGHDVDVIQQIIQRPHNVEAGTAIEWQVDANGSYGPESIEILIRLAQLGVSAIEQPFPAEDSNSASTLVANLDHLGLHCVVVADEAAVSQQALTRLVDQKAATAVTIKPSRYGGLASAAAIIEGSRALGLDVSAGGMIESALGRHALTALAGHDAVTLTGDLSPSSRWMAADPWPDLTTSRTADGTLMVEVPTGSGGADEPDLELLDHLTVRRHVQE